MGVGDIGLGALADVVPFGLGPQPGLLMLLRLLFGLPEQLLRLGVESVATDASAPSAGVALVSAAAGAAVGSCCCIAGSPIEPCGKWVRCGHFQGPGRHRCEHFSWAPSRNRRYQRKRRPRPPFSLNQALVQLASTAWRCSPRPSMPTRMTSPPLRNTGVGLMPMPTPGGVPVTTTSPGSSVMQ